MALCLVIGVTCATNAAEPASPLNIVVVMVDDLGWMDLSCQGSTFYKTPQIDQLAATPGDGPTMAWCFLRMTHRPGSA